jgi:hypothetical protein
MDTLEKVNFDGYQFAISPYQGEIKQKTGRPLFGGKDEKVVVAKLQFAFSIGAQTIEACGYSDISTDSFYRYCRNHPEFRNKIEGLQANPTFLARLAIFNSIQAGDVKTSRWYLERKCPSEFSPNPVTLLALDEMQKRVEQLERKLIQNNIAIW